MKKSCVLLPLSLILLFCTMGSAQTPGGVPGTTLKLWLRADKNITASEGASIPNWNSYAGSYNFTQGGGTKRFYQTNANWLVNYNPSVVFDGSGDFRNSTRLFPNNSPYIIFTVGKNMSTGGNRATAGFGDNGDYPALDQENTSSGSGYANNWRPVFSFDGGRWYNSVSRTYNGIWPGSVQQPQLFGISSPNGNGGTAVTSYVDNFTENTGRNSNQNTQIGNGVNIGSSGDATWVGPMNEVIVFNGALTATQILHVNSYLALKYGITLKATNSVTGFSNYESSNGTVIWNATTNAGFTNNVAGIGRDDNSDLMQKQSRSVNDNTNFADPMANGNMLAVGLGEIFNSNFENGNAFTSDNSFLIWGDNGVNGTQTSQVPGSATVYGRAGISVERLSKVWKVQNTAMASTVQLKFQLTNAQVSGNELSDFKLLVNNTSNFSTTTAIIAASAYNAATRIVTFNDITLANGQYFTLATAPIVAPGGIDGAALKLWIRADRQIVAADGAAITAWNAFSGGYNFTQGGGTKKYYNTTPDFLVNYNPSVYMDGSGDFRNANRLFDNKLPFSIFSVGKPTANNTSTHATVGFGNNGDYPAFDLENINSGPGYANVWRPNFSFAGGRWNGSKSITYNGVWPGSIQEPQIFGLSSPNSSTSGDDVTSYVDFFQESTGRKANQDNQIGNGTYLGSSGDGNWVGELNEVIVFNRNLTATELLRVHSYLAIKYGISLRNPSTLTGFTDYQSSNGTVTWSTATNAGFTYNVTGIGRDDNSDLNQKQSRSVNDNKGGSDPMRSGSMLAIGLGAIAASNAANTNTFAADNTFLVWADNGLSGKQSTQVPNGQTLFGSPVANISRTKIEWKVQQTGTVGPVEMRFDLSTSSLSASDISDVKLLINNSSPDFTTADRIISPSGYDAVANVFTFSNVTLSSGQYFILASKSIYAPGGVVADLTAWFRADDPNISIADASNINSGGNDYPTTGAIIWPDFTGTSFGLFSGSGNNKQYYKTTPANLVNFNPSFKFNRDGTGLVNANQVIPDNSPFQLFGVARDESGSPGDLRCSVAMGNQGDGVNFDMQRDGTSPGGWNFRVSGSNPVEYGGGNSILYNGNTYSGFGRIPQIYGLSSTNISTAAADNVYSNVDNYTQQTVMDAHQQSGIGKGMIAGSSGDAQWTGTVNEVILYARKLSAIEQLRVNSYLAIKYGITLRDSLALPLSGTPNGNGVIPGLQSNGNNQAFVNAFVASNYVRADSTVIWSVTKNANYNFNIAGIGRDDKSNLSQRQSASQDNLTGAPIGNPGIDFMWKGNMLTIGLGTIANSNGENPNLFNKNEDFIMWGDNGVPPTVVTTNLPDGYSNCLGNQRLALQWKVQVTGTAYNNLSLQFDLNNITGINGTTIDQLALLIDADGDGDFTTGNTRVYSVKSFTGNIVKLDSVTLNDGEVFTLLTKKVQDGVVYLTPPASTVTTNTLKCTENNGWKYFYEGPSGTPNTHKVIAMNANGNNVSNFSGISVSINTNFTPAQLNKATSTGASSLMDRLIQITGPATTYSVNGGVRIRIYYSPAELNVTTDSVAGAQTRFDISGGVNSGWFKAENTIPNVVSGLTQAGISGQVAELVPDSTGVEDGVNFVEFRNITGFSTFGYIAQILAKLNISGNVWDDGNGNITKQAYENYTNAQGNLYAEIVDADGNSLASTPVSNDGTYAFSKLLDQQTAYKVIITSTPGVATVAVPAGYANTGQDSSGKIITVPLGVISLNTGSDNLTNLNFGVDQLPTSDNKIFTNIDAANFGLTGVPGFLGTGLDAVAFGTLTGSDPEDCASTGTCAIGKTFQVHTLNVNTRLLYNGVQITNQQIIPNFDPSLMKVFGQLGSGVDAPIGFTYSLIDSAGKASATPAIYSITTIKALGGIGTDLTPGFRMPQTTFTPTAVVTRDFIINITELNGVATNTAVNGSVVIVINKPSAFNITFDPALTSMMLPDLQTLNNADWTMMEDANSITFTSKPGVNIGANGVSKIGLTTTVKSEIGASTVQVLTAGIINGSSSDTNDYNNAATSQWSIQF